MCNVFLIQKVIIRIMLRLGPSSSCRDSFKVLDILTLPSLYIFACLFLERQTTSRLNSSIHSIDMRRKNQLRLPSVKFSSVQRGVTYSSIEIFNKLPLNVSQLHTDIITFTSVLSKFLVKNVIWSTDDCLLIVMLIIT